MMAVVVVSKLVASQPVHIWSVAHNCSDVRSCARNTRVIMHPPPILVYTCVMPLLAQTSSSIDLTDARYQLGWPAPHVRLIMTRTLQRVDQVHRSASKVIRTQSGTRQMSKPFPPAPRTSRT